VTPKSSAAKLTGRGTGVPPQHLENAQTSPRAAGVDGVGLAADDRHHGNAVSGAVVLFLYQALAGLLVAIVVGLVW
jgi:hypothetical protein